MKSIYQKFKSKLTSFIIKKVAGDYERLKEQNESLRNDIYALVKKSNKPEGIEAKFRWCLLFDLEDMTWMETKIQEVKDQCTTTNGLLPLIQK